MLKFVNQHGTKLLGFHGLRICPINKITNVGQCKSPMEMLEWENNKLQLGMLKTMFSHWLINTLM
jgi:hypothetical protein